MDEALGAVEAAALALPEEDAPVERAVGLVLARDVVALHDHPRTDNSAMDGFAVRHQDLPGRLLIAGESRAGAPLGRRIEPGEAARVSTGAELPQGADTVLRIEDAFELDGEVHGLSHPGIGRDVRRRAEDLATGDVLVPAGTLVSAHAVAAMLASGQSTVACHRPARVAVLASGDELVDHGGQARRHQVVDANGPGVAAQAEAAGADIVALTRVGDDRAATERAVAEMLAPSHGVVPDLVVTIGGVSVGRHDHMRGALQAAGVRQLLWGVAIRPGHPVWLGEHGAQRVLGLPGNPVSAAVCFHVFGRPLMGLPSRWDRSAPLARGLTPSPRRTDLVRCRFVDGALEPLPRQGSHDLSSLATAEALARIPASESRLHAGTLVRYQPLG